MLSVRTEHHNNIFDSDEILSEGNAWHCPIPSSTCTHFNHGTSYDGFVVCLSCGTVLGTNNMETFTVKRAYKSGFNLCYGHLKSVPYRKINHFNQILLSWSRECRPLPGDLVDWVVDQADRMYQSPCCKLPAPSELTKQDIQIILRFASEHIPDDLRDKHKSCKFKCRPLTNLVERKQYSLRWWLIKDAIARSKDPDYVANDVPPGDLVFQLQALFRKIVAPFNVVRHEENCDGLPSCHKRFGCRFSILNVYYIIQEMLAIIYDLDDDEDLATVTRLTRYFPELTGRKLEKLKKIWGAIMLRNRWEAGELRDRMRVQCSWGLGMMPDLTDLHKHRKYGI